jgi:hypothetical protein
MMNYDMMRGDNGGGMMFFSWIIYLLVVVALALAIAALWKYVSKK